MTVRARLAERQVGVRDLLQVLLDADATHVDELDDRVLVVDAEPLPEPCRPVSRVEAVDVDPAVEDEKLPVPEPALVKETRDELGRNEHLVDGVVKGDHVLPRERLEADVAGVVLDVFGDAGVVRGRRLDLQRLGGEQGGEPDDARRADLDLREARLLQIPEQVEERRDPDLEAVVLRKVQLGDRREELEPARRDEAADLRIAEVLLAFVRAQASHHREIEVAANGLADHAPDRGGHAVDVEEGVGDEHDPLALRETEGLAHVPHDEAVGALLEERHEIRQRDEHVRRGERGELLDEADEVEPAAVAQVGHVAREDPVEERADDEEDAVVRLVGGVEVRERRAKVGVREEPVDLGLEQLLEGLVSRTRTQARERTGGEDFRAEDELLAPALVAGIERQAEQRVHRTADAEHLRARRLVLGAPLVEELEHRVREGDRAAVSPAGARLAAPDGVDHVVGGGPPGVRKLRPGASGVDAGVVVRTSDDALPPRLVSLRLDAVLAGEALDRRAIQRLQHSQREIVQGLGPRPVLHLERAAEEERLLDVLDRERALATVGPVLGAHQRVGHEVREAILAASRGSLRRNLAVDVGDHLVDVRAQAIDLRELRLRHVGDGHVDVAPVLGERRRHLGADEDVALPGVEQLADAVDRVVIRQGDECHAALLEEPVELHGIGVGLGQRERVGRVVVRHVRGIRMEVEVYLAPERSFHRLLSLDRDPRDRLRALSSVSGS